MDEHEVTEQPSEHPVEPWSEECRRWIEAAHRYERASLHRRAA
jgi:hypothetical protein